MKKTPSLLFCIAMDAIGMLTFIIPWFGEMGDMVWAPLSAIIFYISFGGKKGALGAVFSFIEEILPFLDFIPTFTIGWLYFHFVESKKTEPSARVSNTGKRAINI